MNFLKVRKIIFFIYLFSLKFDFGISYKTNINRISPIISPIYSISLKTPENFANKKEKIQNKFRSFLKIIRSNNIPATTFLCFSGGWIMNPDLFSLFQNRQFWISTLSTNLIMSASMIINDIFDMEVDQINSAERPLITGEITKSEAIRYTFGLLFITEFMTLFLQAPLRRIVHFAMLFTIIYTPILKRILFVKNLSCANIVGFSLIFSGLSSSRTTFFNNPNREILLIAFNTIFCGSLTNELLMDMRDYIGDKMNNINTVSTYFGKRKAYILINFIMYLNIFINFGLLIKIFHLQKSVIYILLFIQQLVSLRKIGEKCEYSKGAIKKYMFQTNKTLVFLLLYFCFLSR